jgi:hypothetical protein
MSPFPSNSIFVYPTQSLRHAPLFHISDICRGVVLTMPEATHVVGGCCKVHLLQFCCVRTFFVGFHLCRARYFIHVYCGRETHPQSDYPLSAIQAPKLRGNHAQNN